jgi:hypothetical protein
LSLCHSSCIEKLQFTADLPAPWRIEPSGLSEIIA